MIIDELKILDRPFFDIELYTEDMIIDELKILDMFRPFFDIELYTEGGTMSPMIRFISKNNECVSDSDTYASSAILFETLVYEYKISSTDLFVTINSDSYTGPTITAMVESMKSNLRDLQLNKIGV